MSEPRYGSRDFVPRIALLGALVVAILGFWMLVVGIGHWVAS